MTKIEPLKEPNVECWYDEVLEVGYIKYGKMISPEVTHTVYGWMGRSIEAGIEHNLLVRGCIFDFTLVESFYPGNITTAKTESRTLRSSEHAAMIAKIPVAIIAANDHQKMMVGISMKQSKRDTGTDNPMVRVVKNKDEAIAFIKSFSTVVSG